MTPPLRQRLGLAPDPRPLALRHGDRGLMARSLMFLFFAGATMSLLALVLVDLKPADETRMFATTASAYGIAIVALVGYNRLPRWTFPLFLACGTVLIEWTIYASGESTSAYAMFYFWIAIYAFYFFTRRMAALQLGFIACSYAAVLAVIPDASNPSVMRWAITTSALVVAGALIGLLKERVDKLIAALGEASHSDTITGLLNRRAFVDTLEMELERARRGRVETALISLSLDWPSGPAENAEARTEHVLELAGAAVRRAVRRIDVAARTGDRTLGVIVPYGGGHGAYVLAERIQAEVLEGLARTLPGNGANVAVGVASFPQDAATVEELRHAAEQAVAAARRLGHNRVVSYAPAEPTPVG